VDFDLLSSPNIPLNLTTTTGSPQYLESIVFSVLSTSSAEAMARPTTTRGSYRQQEAVPVSSRQRILAHKPVVYFTGRDIDTRQVSQQGSQADAAGQSASLFADIVVWQITTGITSYLAPKPGIKARSDCCGRWPCQTTFVLRDLC